MLSIGKLGKGQERYYLDKVAEGAEGYYSGEGEAEGQWLGSAAEALGLEGAVEADQLTAMLTGHNPVTGEPLGLRAVGGRGAVPGFDLTFSIPKSASLLWALGDAETSAAITAAVDASLAAALGYLEREACWTRRGADAEFVKGNGFLASGWRHRSSRNGDPQVHVHALIANATQGPDGKWTRLYHPAIYDHAKTAGYLFEAHFRHELTQRLAVRWQEVRNGIAEIEGFADGHLREFSTRRAEIIEAAGPGASARSRQIATLATRKGKEQELTTKTLRERWHSKAQEIGLEVEGIERDFSPGAPSVARTASTWQVGRAVTAGVSHFDRRDAIQAVAGLLREGAEASEVERMADVFLASDEVVPLGAGPKGDRYTTRRIWELEREAFATVERMRAGGLGPAGEVAAERVILARPTLMADQREMVRRLLVERTGIAVVIGEAGTGKSFAIVAAAEGWAREGIELRAAAPTWRAANVMRAEGLPAQSIASLLAELDRPDGGGGLTRGSVLLIDEAGMVDTATLARLIDHARRAEAKLVLVGDPEQLSEIEAGGLFRAVAERSEPIYLREVIRHRFEAEREGAKRIREGEGREALALYRSEERVIVAPDAETRREAMVSDWSEARERGEDAVMVAKRNAEVEQLNALAREQMRETGRLGAAEIEVGGASFAAGDLVITRVNDRRQQIYNRERWRVTEVDVDNRGVVLQGVDQGRTVEVGADYLARTNSHSDAPALQHAYAITTYSAQGTTVDRAYVATDASMDKQELYVAASRSRGETLIYATPEIRAERSEIAPVERSDRGQLEHIAEASVRDRAQRAAHEVARLEALPSAELARRREELWPLARQERDAEGRSEELRQKIEQEAGFLAGIEGQRERAAGFPRKLRRQELQRIDQTQTGTEARLAKLRVEAEASLPIRDEARRELAAVGEVLAERAGLATTVTRLASLPYVLAELGERPADPAMARLWDRGVAVIEGYRERNGVKDRTRAFGAEPKDAVAQGRRRSEMQRVQQLQRQLRQEQGREQMRQRSIERGFGLGI